MAEDYARLFRDAPIGIFRSDREGRITRANPALVRLLGFDSEEEVLRLDLGEDVYADASTREDLIRQFGRGAYSGVAARWVRADAEVITVRLSGRPIHDDDGRLRGFENFVEDVTERREAERALDRVLFSSGAVLFRLRVGDDGSFEPEWVSDSVEEVLGYEPPECLDPGWWSSGIHPDDREATFQAVSRVLTDGEVVHEYRFRAKDGSYRWIRDEGHLLRDSAGRPREVVGVWTDITTERECLEELRRSEERFRALTAAAPDGIVTLDRGGRINYLNAAAQEIFGYDPGELLGRHFIDLFPERFHHINREALDRMLEAPSPESLRARSLLGVRKDGTEFPTEVAFTVDPRREGLAVTAIIRDVTDRVEIQAERSLLRSGYGVHRDASGRERGIVPICSGCKSLKDEAGEWQPVETYVRERAPVEFSHGLCDDCAKSLYGSLAEGE